MSNKALRYRQPESRTSRKTRREKIADKEVHEVKPKFQEEREESYQASPLVPKTLKQRQYLQMLKDPNIHIIVATGLFGTGKTFCPSAHAADLLRTGKIDKIIVARPYVTTGKTSGAKPGTSLEKLRPFVRTMLDTMKQRMGRGAFEIALDDGEQGTIEVQELESIRGRSFDERSYLIVDEAQQSTPEEMLSIVTRISDDCKLILCGDLRQRDVAGASGLKWFMDFAIRHNIEGVGVIDFDSEDDIVRGGIVRDIAIGLMSDERHGLKTPQS